MRHRAIVAAFIAMCCGASTSAQAQTFATYHCRDGSEFVAAFYQGARSAAVKLDGKNMTLPRRLSAFGTRYASGDVAIRMRGKVATLTRGRTSTECTPD